MVTVRPPVKKHWARRPSVWLLIVVILYAAVGFLGVPFALKRVLPEQAAANLGWTLTVDEISFDPFAVELVLTGVRAEDARAQPVLAAGTVTVDYGLLRLLSGVVAFDEIALEFPEVQLDLTADGALMLANDWAERHPPTPEAPEAEDASPLAFLLSEIRITGGVLTVVDQGFATPVKTVIAPLDMDIADFGTLDENAGTYHFEASLGQNGKVSWDGTLQPTPFRSTGRLVLSGLPLELINPYLERERPLQIKSGELALAARYAVSADDQLSLSLNEGEVSVTTLALEQIGTERPLATFDALDVSGIDVDLRRRSIEIGEISLKALSPWLLRQADGQFAIEAVLARGKETREAIAEQHDEWLWRVGAIKVGVTEATLDDRSLATPTELQVRDLALVTGEISHESERMVPLELALTLPDAEPLTVKGEFSTAPLRLNARLEVPSVALAPYTPYLQQVMSVAVKDGAVALSGDVTVEQEVDVLRGSFDGDARLTNLDVDDVVQQRKLLGVRSVALTPLNIRFDPPAVTMGELRIDDPYLQATRLADARLNFDALIVHSTPDVSVETSTDPNAPIKADTATAPLKVEIGAVILNGGQVDIADLTAKPPLTTRLHALKATVKGLSSENVGTALLAAEAKVDEAGMLMVKGQINPFVDDTDKDLRLTLSGYDMTPLSPYAGRFLGYTIAQGKLALDLNYALTGTTIKGSNQVRMDGFSLGKKTDSPDAVSAPVSLGLALLTDRNGVIDVSLPIEGDVKDPNFRVARIVGQALVNLLAKAATSPFAMLGSIAGGGEGDLSRMPFPVGQASVSEEVQANVVALAKVLQARPALSLTLRGVADPAADAMALQQAQLRRRLGALDATTTDPKLEKLLAERSGAKALAAWKTQSVSLSDDSRRLALFDRVATTEVLQGDEMSRLAKARAAAVRNALVQQGVPEAQLFIGAPDLTVKADSEQVLLKLELGART